MEQGLEKLFWLVGGLLVLPFIIQQGIILNQTAATGSKAPQLYSIPVTSPAMATRASTSAAAEPSAQMSPEVRYPDSSTHGTVPDSSQQPESRMALWEELTELADAPEFSQGSMCSNTAAGNLRRDDCNVHWRDTP